MENEVEVEILPNENCKELVATGEVVEAETLDDVIDEADEKNSQKIAEDLQELGDLYERAQNQIESGKLQAKAILDRGKKIAISKGMIETYIAMKNYNSLNRYAIQEAINDKQK